MRTDSEGEKQKQRAIDYLLGKLSNENEVAFEESYFEDSDLFEYLCAVEQDLIEDYLNGNLSKEDRELFDQHYRTTARWKENAPFSKALLQTIKSEVTDPEVVPAKDAIRETSLTNKASILLRSGQFLMANAQIVIVVLIAISGWLIFETRRIESRLRAEEQKRAMLENTKQELSSQLEQQREYRDSLFKDLQAMHGQFKSLAGAPRASESFLLSPQSTRGGDSPQEIRIHSGVRWVELRLEIAGHQFKDYKAVVRPVGGEPVWFDLASSQVSSSASPTSIVELPADRLKTGTYLVTLEGFTDDGKTKYVGQYLFVIVQK